MEKVSVLPLIDELLELPAGTLKGEEALASLEGWNSLAVIGFMALVNENTGTVLSPKQISACISVDDLILLAA